MVICNKRKSVLDYPGHILVEGGPGAGKTTLALLKAQSIFENELLHKNQKVLFLSFARATIYRIEEQAKGFLANGEKKALEINTYHGFTWTIIQSYGYLLKKHRHFKLITPPNFAAGKAGFKTQEEIDNYKYHLLDTDGIICFDIFAELVTELLERSLKIRSLLSDKYPFIIVDEFQDTDSNEWKIIKLLGQKSKIIALADLNQRIFEFRGASVKRIPEFNEHFESLRVDLGKENNRSNGRDIVQFGDDLLTGKNKGKIYNDVHINYYNYNKKDLRLPLFIEIQQAFKRKKMQGNNHSWSLAILVKRKLDTLKISSYLTSKKINHEVIIDPEGPALAASVISKLMEPTTDWDYGTIIDSLLQHLKGRKSTKISLADLKLIEFLEAYQQGAKIVGAKRKQLIAEIEMIITERQNLIFTGSPDKDWIMVRNLFQKSEHELLHNLYEDAIYIRLLNKGAVLLEKLTEQWRRSQCYQSASKLVEDALTQEHFAMTNRAYSGVFVMNLHKSKGKEFEEVIIWEEQYNPIISSDPDRTEQDKLVLRVAVTRARSLATFFTPKADPCILL
ncbi:DNA helicase-2/ATP-dependent DNA helicase PcrA [Chryseobacterium rhizosphaerae]|uniref:UvrD-helicase domain-containing protein n=1 Tax=Chryseobacterium rhizosphaerae TaxID=395937 RepID=UPI00285C07BA|nr:UvrD-helicase domain-containing protein [Chryseobacterium rhizosphaerae]MDR6546753.1 DNA helicase-2/ATP-dependent DNA helicase PcrA [Chryseobacterium rhizosphaerae]